MKVVLNSPYTTRDAPRVMNTNELVAGGSNVKVRLLLVDEEGVGHPDVLDELRADAQRLDVLLFGEREPWVRPELPEVKIQREVLAGEIGGPFIRHCFVIIADGPRRARERRGKT